MYFYFDFNHTITEVIEMNNDGPPAIVVFDLSIFKHFIRK